MVDGELSETRKCLKQNDRDQITTVKELRSWRFEYWSFLRALML